MWWLVILAIGLFMVVSVLPCCKGKEILWIFVGWGICAVPVNIHLLYDHLDYIGCFVDEWDARDDRTCNWQNGVARTG